MDSLLIELHWLDKTGANRALQIVSGSQGITFGFRYLSLGRPAYSSTCSDTKTMATFCRTAKERKTFGNTKERQCFIQKQISRLNREISRLI